LAIETPWDAANVAIGATSLVANLVAGNISGASVDLVGLVYDVAATAVPGVPGGAATIIKAERARQMYVNSSKLARAMMKAGKRVKKGCEAAHHIVAKAEGRFPSAKRARDILKKAKIDINDAVNGVALPINVHRPLHTEKYYQEIERRLSESFSLKGRQGVIDELERIAADLQKGAF
jgi:hypothetical protein